MSPRKKYLSTIGKGSQRNSLSGPKFAVTPPNPESSVGSVLEYIATRVCREHIDTVGYFVYIVWRFRRQHVGKQREPNPSGVENSKPFEERENATEDDAGSRADPIWLCRGQMDPRQISTGLRNSAAESRALAVCVRRGRMCA